MMESELLDIARTPRIALFEPPRMERAMKPCVAFSSCGGSDDASKVPPMTAANETCCSWIIAAKRSVWELL